jgi:hypothetical protein
LLSSSVCAASGAAAAAAVPAVFCRNSRAVQVREHRVVLAAERRELPPLRRVRERRRELRVLREQQRERRGHRLQRAAGAPRRPGVGMLCSSNEQLAVEPLLGEELKRSSESRRLIERERDQIHCFHSLSSKQINHLEKKV